MLARIRLRGPQEIGKRGKGRGLEHAAPLSAVRWALHRDTGLSQNGILVLKTFSTSQFFARLSAKRQEVEEARKSCFCLKKEKFMSVVFATSVAGATIRKPRTVLTKGLNSSESTKVINTTKHNKALEIRILFRIGA